MRFILWTQSLLFMLFCLASLPLTGAGHLERLVMEIQLKESGTQIEVYEKCQVRLREFTGVIPLKAIIKDRVPLHSVTIKIAGKTYNLLLEPQDHNVWTGELDVGNIGLKGDSIALEITYGLSLGMVNLHEQRLTVPVLFVDWKPEQSSNHTFRCALEIDQEWGAIPVFPAVNWSSAKSDGKIMYQMSLQVVPAWVAFDFYQGKLPVMGFIHWVDLGVLVVMGMSLFYFFRRFQFLRS